MKKMMFLFCLLAVATGAERKPNFILFLADDQGWNALSTRMDPDIPGSGSAYYQTPRIAKLASQGVCFSRAHAAAPTCSPTRHSIQFGRSPSSLGIDADQSRTSNGVKAEGRDALASILKKIHPEYTTAYFGKWHMGLEPVELGYDVHDGNTGNQNGNSKDPKDPKKIFDLSRRANEFMEEQVQAGKPFFLQISHYADHLKFQALPETIGKYEKDHADKATEYQNSPLWAAMNENLDTGIGMVLDKVDALGIAYNTYIIYTADNGYECKRDNGKPVAQRQYYKAYPLLSHKYVISEGGIRVPFIIRGPGIPAGSASKTPVISYDIFPTIMDILGRSDAVPETVEGGSLLPLARNKGFGDVARQDLFFVFQYTRDQDGLDIAIVQGDYKLLKEIKSNTLHLWNIAEDLGEQKNLIKKEPERADQMHETLMAYLKHVGWSVKSGGM